MRRATAVTQVGGELVDPLECELLIAVGVERRFGTAPRSLPKRPNTTLLTATAPMRALTADQQFDPDDRLVPLSIPSFGAGTFKARKPNQRGGALMMDPTERRLLAETTVVIRSVSERTEAACRALIEDQGIEPNQIEIVHEMPFERALHVSFSVAIDYGRPWTYCIDADLLLGRESLVKMLTIAHEMPESTCEIQGRAADKLLGTIRPCGNHLYRTAHLEFALQEIPVPGESSRPELETLNRLKRRGLGWDTVPLIVGIHDYEQYYKDIFRKARLHSSKHSGQHHRLIDYWRKQASYDPDFEVALAGYASGIAELGAIAVTAHDDAPAKWLSQSRLNEKTPLVVVSPDDVRNRIVRHTPLNGFEAQYSADYSITRASQIRRKSHSISSVQKLIQLVKTYGISNGSLVALGIVFRNFGKRLVRRATKRPKMPHSAIDPTDHGDFGGRDCGLR